MIRLRPLLLTSVAVAGLIAAAQAAETKGGGDGIPVTVATALRQDLPVYLTGIGTVQAGNSVAIHAQVDGQLTKIAFTEGQEVKAGDVLAQIDPRSYQAALDQALARKDRDQALLDNARQDVERYQGLADQNYISRQQLDNAKSLVAQHEADVKGDQAAIAAARIQLEYTTIRTPIEGRVGIRQVDVGNILHGSSGMEGGGGHSPPGGSSDTLVVITQHHPIAVLFTLPQDQLPLVRQALAKEKPEVDVYDRNGAHSLDKGRLLVVDNQIDNATSTIRLKALMPNKGETLWPGQYVSARLQVGTHAKPVTIPGTALLRGEQGEYVYVIQDDSSVAVRKVTSGAVLGDVVEIQSGLEAGENVVADGQYRLKPGSKVTASHTKTFAVAETGR